MISHLKDLYIKFKYPTQEVVDEFAKKIPDQLGRSDTKKDDMNWRQKSGRQGLQSGMVRKGLVGGSKKSTRRKSEARSSNLV